MADNYSFDITSKVAWQEVKNAMDQTTKEIRQRFDLKNTKSAIELNAEKGVIIKADDDYQLKALIDIFQAKLVKRGVSLKALVYEKLEKALGDTVRQEITILQGIASEKAKEITKAIRDSKLKVQTQIQGDQVRVLGKDKDQLQDVIQFVKSKDFGIDLQFSNYR
ncbi:MAG: YajQ family cyclic di-GMP-binding protein [Nitrospirae bacterium]|nr:YajQ family cyclic di-GMP-binding protein [Candidatus Troglogloeales bacterium]MBI3598606.1 YajQ family cyclic di-GMP-binding protein [Candidatus Troglogloeales bacterium]